MKKVLLVGVYSETLNEIKEYLAGEYTVQFCPMVYEQLAGMTRLVKPDVIIICITDNQIPDASVLNWMNQNGGLIQFVFVTSRKNWESVDGIHKKPDYKVIFTPCNRETLLQACCDTGSDRKKTVMIVDDNALVLRNIRGILIDKYDVLLANSGELALSMIQKKHADVVLLDYEMPGMNGKELFAAIKQMPGGSNLPVIFLTSVTDKERIYELLVDRPAGYVIKPPDQKKLIELIERVL